MSTPILHLNMSGSNSSTVAFGRIVHKRTDRELKYNLFIQRMQHLGLSSNLLGPVSDQVLINRVSKGRALHQVIKYSSGAI